MLVIVYNNNVILGPMKWNRYRFENTIFEDCEFSCSLPSRNDDESPIIVSDEIKILPVQGTDNPLFDTKTQILHGPFWEFTDTVAISSYQPMDLEITAAKNFAKATIAGVRWTKENGGVSININGTDYKFATDLNTRAILQQLVATQVDSYNWKFDDYNWLQLSKADIQLVLSNVLSHVQDSFTWEYNKSIEIDNCILIQDLALVDLEK